MPPSVFKVMMGGWRAAVAGVQFASEEQGAGNRYITGPIFLGDPV
jgi:hypothetical protein